MPLWASKCPKPASWVLQRLFGHFHALSFLRRRYALAPTALARVPNVLGARSSELVRREHGLGGTSIVRIAVSACLLGENCKYSGGNNLCPKLVDALSGHEVIPVCPEVLGGLPTPRPPAEIVHGEVRTQAGESVDARFALVPSERLITLKLLAVATLRSCSRAALPVAPRKSMTVRSQAGSFQAAECSFGFCGSMACASCNRMSS